MPEIVDLTISPDTVVHIVVPLKDPLTESVRTISRWANGAITSEVELPEGPAWKSALTDLYLAELREPSRAPLVVPADQPNISAVFAEALSSTTDVSVQCARVGFTVRASPLSRSQKVI